VQTLLDDASAGTVLGTLGFTPFVSGLRTSASGSDFLTALGFSAFGKTIIDDADPTALIATLGLGTMSLQNANAVAITGGTVQGVTISALAADLSIADGGTGASNAPAALTNLGVSAFMQTVLDDADAATARATLGVAGAIYPRGHIAGLTLENAGGDPTNDITIAVGEATDVDRTNIMQLNAALTKQLDAAWAVGTNAGGRDTGAISDAWWHVWLIQRSDTGVVDALFSLSPTGPTMPTNYDRKRRIGAIRRVAGAIVGFTQVGDHFLLDTATLDVNANNPGTSAVSRTMNCPTGIVTEVFGNTVLTSTVVDSLLLITALAVPDVAPSGTAAPLADAYADASGDALGTTHFEIPTDTSAQIRTRLSASDGSTTLRMVTEGWQDVRGKYD
jgi:hypothetical protein